LASAGSSLRGRILVVDDEPEMGGAIRRALPKCEVDVAPGGDVALTLLEGGAHYDVILCDIFMPGTSGAEVYHRLFTDSPALAERIIFITGAADDPSAARLLDGVPNPCLEKPLRLQQLVALVRTYLSAGTPPIDEF
jgi:CheY-like chemotaxis protein